MFHFFPAFADNGLVHPDQNFNITKEAVVISAANIEYFMKNVFEEYKPGIQHGIIGLPLLRQQIDAFELAEPSAVNRYALIKLQAIDRMLTAANEGGIKFNCLCFHNIH